MVFVKNKKVLVFLFLLVFFLSWVSLVFAVETPGAVKIIDRLEESAGISYDVSTQIHPGAGDTSLLDYVANILKVVISFLGAVFFLLIIYAGWLWMSAQGNEEQVEKAKKIVASAIVGLALVLFSGVIAVITYALLKQQNIFSSF